MNHVTRINPTAVFFRFPWPPEQVQSIQEPIAQNPIALCSQQTQPLWIDWQIRDDATAPRFHVEAPPVTILADFPASPFAPAARVAFHGFATPRTIRIRSQDLLDQVNKTGSLARSLQTSYRSNHVQSPAADDKAKTSRPIDRPLFL
jgi:hypothetical protein